MPRAIANDADAQFALARNLWEQSDVVRSEAILRDLLARDPAREDAAMLLAKLLQSRASLDAACALVFDLCRVHDFAPELSLRGAGFIQQCHRHAMADELCTATMARHSVSAAFLAFAGHIKRELGDFAGARALYLAAIQANVDLNSTFVLGALAHTQRYADAGDLDFTSFVAHFNAAQASPRARAATGFGLAKAYDDIGDYAAAARILRTANALVRSELTWSTADWNDFVTRRIGERVALARNAITKDFVPVFVLGLPRTGTTVTATHLARHARARDRGELRILRFIAQQLIDGNHLSDAEAIEEAAVLYFMHARQDDAPATWYIDQDPLNFRYLHIIAAMFPQARIVLCRRERRDTALSLWSQDFAHTDCAFAYDFANIAAYAAGHDALIEHWRQTLPLPILTTSYEDLVADPQRTLATLREFCGMPQADGTTRDAAAPINSSSVWQARQPIYTRSVGRWRAYAPFIPELMQFPAAQ